MLITSDLEAFGSGREHWNEKRMESWVLARSAPRVQTEVPFSAVVPFSGIADSV